MEVLRYSVIPSTQDLARQLALGSHRLPFAVLAQTQSRGRGRLGRDWLSPEGGLWLTGHSTCLLLKQFARQLWLQRSP
jgi:BirA family biotin operon repressor/biotin-[acetyl-CoA-carboxylase] ligase